MDRKGIISLIASVLIILVSFAGVKAWDLINTYTSITLYYVDVAGNRVEHVISDAYEVSTFRILFNYEYAPDDPVQSFSENFYIEASGLVTRHKYHFAVDGSPIARVDDTNTYLQYSPSKQRVNEILEKHGIVWQISDDDDGD